MKKIFALILFLIPTYTLATEVEVKDFGGATVTTVKGYEGFNNGESFYIVNGYADPLGNCSSNETCLYSADGLYISSIYDGGRYTPRDNTSNGTVFTRNRYHIFDALNGNYILVRSQYVSAPTFGRVVANSVLIFGENTPLTLLYREWHSNNFFNISAGVKEKWYVKDFILYLYFPISQQSTYGGTASNPALHYLKIDLQNGVALESNNLGGGSAVCEGLANNGCSDFLPYNSLTSELTAYSDDYIYCSIGGGCLFAKDNDLLEYTYNTEFSTYNSTVFKTFPLPIETPSHLGSSNLFNFQATSLNEYIYNYQYNTYLYDSTSQTDTLLNSDNFFMQNTTGSNTVGFTNITGFNTFSEGRPIVARYINNNDEVRYSYIKESDNKLYVITDDIETNTPYTTGGSGGGNSGSGTGTININGIDYEEGIFNCDQDGDGDCEFLNGEIFQAIGNFFKYIWEKLLSFFSNVKELLIKLGSIFTIEEKTFTLFNTANAAGEITSVLENVNEEEYNATVLGKIILFLKAFVAFFLVTMVIVWVIVFNNNKKNG